MSISRPAFGPGCQFIAAGDRAFWWPSYNEANPFSIQYYIEHLDDWRIAAGSCERKRTVIQAGGSVGLWAKDLAADFATVYTFEPHPDLYQCLVRNVPERNVIKLQAVLGNSVGTVDMKWENFGSHTVSNFNGVYPRMRIDDLKLYDVDLIVLDIEGYEYFALHGARETIERSHPVIMVEEVGAENTPCKRCGLAAKYSCNCD